MSPGFVQATMIEVFEDRYCSFDTAENLVGTGATDRMISAEGLEVP